MYDIVAIGELLIDFAPVQDQTGIYPVMKANPGGAPANFLAALSKYGAKTAFIGKVGTDSFGYSCYELEQAMHIYELPEPHYTWVRILGCQMGIGGDDSWGAPVQRQYWLDADAGRTLAFTVRKAQEGQR